MLLPDYLKTCVHQGKYGCNLPESSLSSVQMFPGRGDIDPSLSHGSGWAISSDRRQFARRRGTLLHEVDIDSGSVRNGGDHALRNKGKKTDILEDLYKTPIKDKFSIFED